MVADSIRFGTKFLLMLFCGFPCQYDHRRSGQFATDSLKRLMFQIAKIFLTFSWAGAIGANLDFHHRGTHHPEGLREAARDVADSVRRSQRSKPFTHYTRCGDALLGQKQFGLAGEMRRWPSLLLRIQISRRSIWNHIRRGLRIRKTPI